MQLHLSRIKIYVSSEHNEISLEHSCAFKYEHALSNICGIGFFFSLEVNK